MQQHSIKDYFLWKASTSQIGSAESKSFFPNKKINPHFQFGGIIHFLFTISLSLVTLSTLFLQIKERNTRISEMINY